MYDQHIYNDQKQVGLEFPLSQMLQTWRLRRENMTTKILEKDLVGSCKMGKVVRCIHAGLRCVPNDAALRPIIFLIVLKLDSWTRSGSRPKPELHHVKRSLTPALPLHLPCWIAHDAEKQEVEGSAVAVEVKGGSDA
ncbi:hypothetical protein EJ110_NYTH12857 [Nymphaea thermarum]|nr:hypothetical protein EJ110_NYTH12857 [Nymphaea thermarum]